MSKFINSMNTTGESITLSPDEHTSNSRYRRPDVPDYTKVSQMVHSLDINNDKIHELSRRNVQLVKFVKKLISRYTSLNGGRTRKRNKKGTSKSKRKSRRLL